MTSIACPHCGSVFDSSSALSAEAGRIIPKPYALAVEILRSIDHATISDADIQRLVARAEHDKITGAALTNAASAMKAKLGWNPKTQRWDYHSGNGRRSYASLVEVCLSWAARQPSTKTNASGKYIEEYQRQKEWRQNREVWQRQ